MDFIDERISGKTLYSIAGAYKYSLADL